MLRRVSGSPVELPLLAAVLSGQAGAADRLAELDESAAETLIALARAHGVEAWLAGHAPRDGAWQELAEQRLRFVAARTRAVAELRDIGRVLDQLGLPWAVLKGQAVAEDLYPKPQLRFGVDHDVLVPPAVFADVIEALTAEGWALLDRNWPLFLDTVPGELRLRAPTGGLLDLHWHLLAGVELRSVFVLPTSGLLARRRTLPSGLPTLDPVDQLVHLALHASLSGATRLSWLLDVHLAACQVGDWSPVLAAARQARADLALELVLRRARHWLGPVGGAPEIARRDWRIACALTDRISPLGARPDEPSLARAFARSVRPTTGASLAELARHGTGWARQGARRTRGTSPIMDPQDPRSPLHAVDDPSARARYFALVAAS